MYPIKLLPVLLGLVALSLLLPVQPAHAAPIRDDEFIIGDDVTLREGEHIDGDLVIIGGNLIMQPGSRVNGNVAALGGDVEINGIVQSDLVVFGGDVHVKSRARIQGDVVAIGGQVHQAQGAQTGEIIQGPSFREARFWRDMRVPLFPSPLSGDLPSIAWSVFSATIMALMVAGLGIVVAAFWPTQTAQVGHTILHAPLPSLGIGCLLYPLAGSLVFFLLITICLAIFVPVIALLLVVAILLGWIALGMLWGRRLVRWLGMRRAKPVVAAGVGVFTLSLITSLVGIVPCAGVLLVLGATSIGLGAVTLSRFGTKRYPVRPSAGSPPEPAATD